jgi:hypothetical protein
LLLHKIGVFIHMSACLIKSIKIGSAQLSSGK